MSFGQKTNERFLNIIDGPSISRTQGYAVTEALMPGSSAILLCVINSNPMNISNIRWFKDNQEISTDLWEKRIDGNETSLIRKSVQRDDAGQYVCEVENQLGSTRATLPLVIQCNLTRFQSKIDFVLNISRCAGN